MKETRGMTPCIILWQWKRGTGRFVGCTPPQCHRGMWRRNERGRKGPPASRLPAHPRPRPCLPCRLLARLLARLPARVLGWSTWWGVDVTASLCGSGPHPPAEGRDATAQMWWIRGESTWSVSTWPCRRGGYAGSRRGRCRRGRVDVVDTRGVDVAVSMCPLSTWPGRS